jgi:hypothetical protein
VKRTRRAAARQQVQTALRRAVGLEHEQLELAITPPERSVITVRDGAVRSFSPSPTCEECGRRGYHLARCSRAGKAVDD